MSEVEAKPQSQMAGWMILVGVVVGIVGAIVMGVASAREDRAELRSAFDGALGGRGGSALVEQAVSLGHLGLGVLIAGGVLALAGLVVVALRR